MAEGGGEGGGGGGALSDLLSSGVGFLTFPNNSFGNDRGNESRSKKKKCTSDASHIYRLSP